MLRGIKKKQGVVLFASIYQDLIVSPDNESMIYVVNIIVEESQKNIILSLASEIKSHWRNYFNYSVTLDISDIESFAI